MNLYQSTRRHSHAVYVSSPIIRRNQMHQFLNFIFGNKTLHVSDSSSVHHQFFTVHTAVVYVIQVCWQLSAYKKYNKIIISIWLVFVFFGYHNDTRSNIHQLLCVFNMASCSVSSIILTVYTATAVIPLLLFSSSHTPTNPLSLFNIACKAVDYLLLVEFLPSVSHCLHLHKRSQDRYILTCCYSRIRGGEL